MHSTSIIYHKLQLCSLVCQLSQASCKLRCIHRTRVLRNKCIPRPDHQHKRRKYDKQMGLGESRNHWDVDTSHLDPLVALKIYRLTSFFIITLGTYGDQVCLHSLRWNSDRKALSFLNMDQKQDHLGRDAPLEFRHSSHSICHIG